MHPASSSSSPENSTSSQEIQPPLTPSPESSRKRAFDASASDHSPPISFASPPVQEEPQGEQPPQKRQRIEFVQGYDGSANDHGSSGGPSTASEQQQDGENNEGEASNSQSDDWSHLIMKIYMNGELYSIYDRSIRDYTYHAVRDAGKGFKIEYVGRRCSLITDPNDMIVYISPRLLSYPAC
ncbi:hypothetical protein F5Y01DRAFT_311482 [Xylaria sp. FL0043]|nr:hypothetical protein F5Y01DRAFT_311482 [Xylaria sp. FL0043]